MNKELIIQNCEDLVISSNTMLDKINTIYKEKSKWNLDDLGKLVDMLKDISQVHKNVAKCCKIFTENSLEEF